MRFKSWLTAGIFIVMVFAFLVPGNAYHFGTAWDESYHYQSTYAPDPRIWTGDECQHGVPTDSLYLDDEHDRGIALRNVYIRWADYQTGSNTWNGHYMNQKRAETQAYIDAGFQIILRVNPFPVPQWYLAEGNVRPKNQFNQEWEPDTVSNREDEEEKYNTQLSIWDANYETRVRVYIEKVFTEMSDLKSNFWGVYIASGQFGEVAFPGRNPVKRADRPADSRGEDYYGNWNCYWAYEADAQTSCPVPGWTPATQAGAGQRAVNGGFEDTLYSATIANWWSARDCHSQGAWNPVVIEDAGQAQEGSRFLRYASPSGAQYYLRQEMPVRAGTNYDLNGYIRALGGETGYIKLSQTNAVGNATGAPIIRSSSQMSWTQVTQNFTTQADAAYVQVDLYLTGGAGTVDFDAISVLDTANPTTDHSQAEQFIQWYYQELANAVKWQIAELQEHYSGRLILMGGGDATRPGDIEAEINNDLSGKTKNAYWVSRGFAVDRYLQILKDDPAVDLTNVYFSNTGMEVVWNDWENPDRDNGAAWNTSPLRSDWSAPKYYAVVAREIWGIGTQMYGENGGLNNDVQMQDAFQNMQANTYAGLGWYTLGQLFEPRFGANILNYSDLITQYNVLPPKSPTGGGIEPVATGWEWYEPRGYDNVHNSVYQVEAYDTSEYGLPLCTQAWEGDKNVHTRTGNNYLVVAGKVADSAATPNCYYWLFNDVLIPYHDVTITFGTKLRYWIYPHDDAGDATDGNRSVAVDLIFSDGTALRDRAELTDQNGFSMHPAQRHDHSLPNTWNYVEVDLSTMAGKTVEQVWLAFDDPAYSSHGRKYRVYIDDLRFDDPAPSFEDDFTGPAGVQPATWKTDSGNIRFEGDGATNARATLLSSTYGALESPVIADFDQGTYDAVEFKVSGLSGGAYFDFGLQQLREEHRDYMYNNTFSHLDVPGVYRVRLSTLAGSRDTSAFNMKFWFNGVVGNTADLDYVKLVQHPPVPVATPSPTGWSEVFKGAANETPAGWRDRKAWGEYNARIENNGAGQGVITLGGLNTYGDVISPVIENLDTQTFHVLEIKIDGLTCDHVDVGIQQEHGSFNYYGALQAAAAGVYFVDLNSIAPGADLSRFSVKLWPNDTARSGTVTLDYVQVVRDEGYADHLQGTAGIIPAGWRDQTNSPASGTAFSADGSSYATVTLNPDRTYGDVWSPDIRGLNTSAHDVLEVKIEQVGAGCYFDIGIQIVNGPYLPAFSGINSPGTHRVRLQDIAAGQDLSAFYIKLWANGPQGATVGKLDYLRIHPEGPAGFVDTFTGPAGQRPTGWTVSECSFLGDGGTEAAMTLTEDSTGVIWSPVIRNLDSSVYDTLEVKVSGVNHIYAVYVNLREASERQATYGVLISFYGTGTQQVNIKDLWSFYTGYMDQSAFTIQVDLLAYGPGDSATLDYVRIISSSAQSTVTPTSTLTHTTTMTVTPTPTVAANPIAGDWLPDGGSLNVNVILDGNNPRLAILEGIPYVSWQEWSGKMTSLYVKRYTGGGNWELAGEKLNMQTRSPYYQMPDQAGNLSLAMVNNTPYATWHEGAGQRENIYVKRFTGSNWERVGGLIGAYDFYQSLQPRLAGSSSGVPHVAWIERRTYPMTNFKVYVCRLSGSDWVTLGGHLNVSEYDETANPVIAFDNDTPYVAWHESSKLYVKHWNGSQWVQNGGQLNVDANQSADMPEIAVAAGTPYVTWLEIGQAYVKSWDGNAWNLLGESLNLNDSEPADHPRIGTDGTDLYATWGEANQIYVKKWSGSVWVLVEDSLNLDPAQGADSSSLALAYTMPYAAFAESNGSDKHVYVKHFEADGFTPPTSTPTPDPTPLPDEYWRDDFTPPSTLWQDVTQDSSYAVALSSGYVSLGDNAPWGKILSPAHHCDVSLYSNLAIKVDNVTGGGTWKIGIQEIGGNWDYWDCSSSSGQTGIFTFDIPAVTGWSGTRDFYVQITIEGNYSAVYVDWVRIFLTAYTPTATATVTATPTATPTAAPATLWYEKFNYSDDAPPANPGDQPAGWYDETDDAAFNAEITYHATDGWATVNAVTGAAWGKVLSFSQDVDLATFRKLEVIVQQVVSGAAKIAVFSNASGWQEYVDSQVITTPGTYVVDIPNLTGWSGIHNLGVELIVEGQASSVVVDSVRIYQEDPNATATPTMTPTVTQTPVPDDAWKDDFVGTAGEQPTRWLDETNHNEYNTEIAYSDADSLSAITRTAEGSWGKTLSEVIACDTSIYTHVEIQVANVLPSTAWKIGIQEEGGSWQYWDLNISHTQSGTFAYNYAAVTGWTGTHSFRVQITVEGNAGAGIEVDWVRVCQEETVTGSAYMGVLIVDYSPTFTVTPTMTLTPVIDTPTPVVSTSTPTPTPTPTPWLAEQKVMSYPNPARGKVNFAYTVRGSAKVNIDIYKLTGERVASINEHVNGGVGQTLSTVWNAIDVAPGIYIAWIRITDSAERVVLDQKKKVALIR